MDRLPRILLLGLLLLSVPACSKAPQTAESANGQSPLTGMPDKDATPDKFVTALLTAAQSGNKPTVMALLSSRTTDTAKTNIANALDSCQNSKFEVGHWEIISAENDRAHVACTLVDHDEKGNEFRHDVVCGLVKEMAVGGSSEWCRSTRRRLECPTKTPRPTRRFLHFLRLPNRATRRC